MTSISGWDQLVVKPAENLSVEMKCWIDPETPEGKCKIVKTCLALRNFDGGYFILGFRNDGEPDTGNAPKDVYNAFHPDKIQALITEFASEPFEVVVGIGQRKEGLFPIIKIPSGVETPVATKKPLVGPGGKKLIFENQIFIRTLNANNTASTAIATHKDWKDIVKICFDNREADIAKFIKRHLSNDLLDKINLSSLQASKAPSQLEKLEEFTSISEIRLKSLLTKLKNKHDCGFLTISFALSGASSYTAPSRAFLDSILSSNPNLTGWPLWLDSRGFEAEEHPYVYEDCWETFLPIFEPSMEHLDYWRASSSGFFIHIKGLEDDIRWRLDEKGPIPLATFEYSVVMRRVGEAVACALAFARTLKNNEETSITLRLNITRLAGRRLSSWGTPGAFAMNVAKCHQDEFTATKEFKSDISKTAVADIVHEITKGLLVLFGGYEVNKLFVQQLIDRLFARQW